METTISKWPKVRPPLTAEQARINDEFLKLWHEVLPKRYGVVERFNHGFPVRHSTPGFRTTLEIGAGLGEHIRHERLTAAQEAGYHALELREGMAAEIRTKFPGIHTIVGDCQKRLDFPDGHFDRVIAVHVLEHLPDLPACIREARRLLNPDRGVFLVVIPTEGSPAYSLARTLSAARVYRKRFGGDYSWIPKREHINLPAEILEELKPYFAVEVRRFFPFPFLPATACNLCIGLALKPRPVALQE
jgi:SAM-dependent methyltransferase